MPIEIIGAESGAEREAAEFVRNMFDSFIGTSHKMVIIVGAKCLGENTQDIDLMLLGTFGSGLRFTGGCGETKGRDVRLVNLCLIIEVKDHSGSRLRFDSQRVKVKYVRDRVEHWEDVSEQVFQQKIALRNYLLRYKLSVPRIEGVIWLRNYDGLIPAAAANVIGSNPSLIDFLRLIEKIWVPKRADNDYFISFSRNADINSIQKISSFLRPTIIPTILDRKRLELICKRLISDQKYAIRLGQQLLIFRGRGGSGKTIHLLRLAKDLYDDGRRVLLLTFNKALVADIRRLLVILGINNQGFDKGIHISTAHKYFIDMLSIWDLKSYNENSDEFFRIEYPKFKSELLQLLSNETPESLCKEPEVQNAPEVFAWDYILIDESQDWPEDERDLLYRCFGPHRCIIADGVDQLTRGVSPCDWTAPLLSSNRQTVPLRRALRMKSNLCRFIKAYAEEAGGEWDQEINEEIPGGSVTIIEGPYTLVEHNEIFKHHRDHGNEPIDALFCVPPDAMADTIITDSLRDWGLLVWDGTSSNVRDTFPTQLEEHRVVRYESCRGLEGWTVVCIGLDCFYENRLRHAVSAPVNSLFDSPADFAHRQAVAWTLIPLTRAIDHLVIQIEKQGFVADICRKLANMHPDFVTWRKE